MEKSICWKRFKGVKDKLQFKTQPKNMIIYSKGDVVALKHNYKRYIIPFFLAVLLKDLHHNGGAFLEDHMSLRWLEQSEDDPLVYQTGYGDDRNSPECISSGKFK